jgi:hypothetical protein
MALLPRPSMPSPFCKEFADPLLRKQFLFPFDGEPDLYRWRDRMTYKSRPPGKNVLRVVGSQEAPCVHD